MDNEQLRKKRKKEKNNMNDIISSRKELLFHYTSLDSALKIIASNTLLFGKFEEMNDIAEMSRLVYRYDKTREIEEEIKKYQAISLTSDGSFLDRGFAIDSMWGYYADKGNGCCLVFDKRELKDAYLELVKKSPTRKMNLKVTYKKNISCTQFFSESKYGYKGEEKTVVKKNLTSIFYIKDSSWNHEKEVRLIIRSESQTRERLKLKKSLHGVILCLPRESDIKQSTSFKLVKKIFSGPIYHYTTKMNGKVLYLGDTLIWPQCSLE